MSAARAAGEQGRVSIFLAIAVTGLLFITGVAHDVSVQIRTALQAELVAAEAARAAGQAVNPDRVAADGQPRVDPAAARGAAQDYLADSGTSGRVDLSADLSEVTVTVTETRSRAFLQLFGFPDYEVQRRATAQLVSG